MSVDLYFQIKLGLQDYFLPDLVTILPTDSTIIKMAVDKNFDGFADFVITISSKKLARDNVDLQLGNVEREIMRLVCGYKPEDIPNILEMYYLGMERIYDNQNWAKSNWSSRTFIRVRY